MKRLSTLINRFVSRRDPDGAHYHLSRLWRHWPEVVGEHIAELAAPIGHRGTTLVLGAEDQMLLQDLGMYSPAILEQVNAFLGMNFFDKVRVDLIGDHVSLDALPGNEPPAPPFATRKPDRLGGLTGRLDPDSPVARAYQAYVRSFGHGTGGEEGASPTDEKFPKED